MSVVPVTEVEAGGSGLQSHSQQYRTPRLAWATSDPVFTKPKKKKTHRLNGCKIFVIFYVSKCHQLSIWCYFKPKKAHKEKFPNYSLVPLFANILNWDSTT